MQGSRRERRFELHSVRRRALSASPTISADTLTVVWAMWPRSVQSFDGPEMRARNDVGLVQYGVVTCAVLEIVRTRDGLTSRAFSRTMDTPLRIAARPAPKAGLLSSSYVKHRRFTTLPNSCDIHGPPCEYSVTLQCTEVQRWEKARLPVCFLLFERGICDLATQLDYRSN